MSIPKFVLDKGLTLHGLFEAQVEKTPEAIALVLDSEQLTYRELNERANQLAHYLRSLNVAPEMLVGICIERSIEMIVGMLGILKAGGAFVPLDPSMPQERLAFILDDTKVSVFVTLKELLASIPLPQCHLVCLDAAEENIAAESNNPTCVANSDNLAYTIYTSGSTGQPKGVMVSHQAICQGFLWMQETFPISQSDRILQKLPLTFDFSFWELFWPLMTGACVVLAKPGGEKDIDYLVKLIFRQEISLLVFVPSVLQVFLSHESLKTCKNIRMVFTGGEPLTSALKDKVFNILPNCQLYDLFGATENIIVTYWACQPEENLSSFPFGCPFPNLSIYVVDEDLQPVPPGEKGELLVGGWGLARGYLNRPELTAQKFISNPFKQNSQERLYRTGDLVRYLSNGTIEILGRIDHQVKIRGFRIELGEIEEKLSQHSAVKQAVVVDREDVPGQKRLVAYIVVKQQNQQSELWPSFEDYRMEGKLIRRTGEIINFAFDSFHHQQPEASSSFYDLLLSEGKTKISWNYSTYKLPPGKISRQLVPHIRSFLEEKLPDYMVPSSFMVVDALPLSPNGKVDRRALPMPDTDRPELRENFVVPRTSIEEVLVGIWAEVLSIERVGVYDNFFELGGHSLLAAQIINQVCVSFGVELAFGRLLEFPTVAGLAKIVEEAQKKEQHLQSIPLQPISRNQTIPLSYSQEQLWFLAQLEPDTPVYNEPFTIRFGGAINVDALSKALNEIIKRHESLRTRFITVDGQPVQAINPPSTFNLTVVDLRQLPQEERETEALRLATKEAKELFDLTSEPLLRATLMQLASQEYRLFLTFHHIVFDGFSIYNVFLPELTALYEAFSTGQSPLLSNLPIQYADFALWQRQWLTVEILENQLDYWKQQLADLPPLQLPYDRTQPAKRTSRGARQCLTLSKELTAALKALSQQSGVTLYMTLLAAFKTLLYRYTGQEDIVVGTVSAGRNRPEMEGLIGYFLNTLVLRTNLSGSPSFRQILSRVREVTLGAYAHEDLPFKKLVETLQPERSLGQNPLFQVAFVLEPPMPSFNLDWNVSYLDIQTDTAKFDLTLELEEKFQGIVGRFEYNTDLFDASTISRMIGHFQTILAAIVTDPDKHLWELPLLTAVEQQQLVAWNNTLVDYPLEACIHQLFEEQVELTPNAVAVVFEGKQLTYQQLNAKANQLAHYLQTLGVGPEVLVGICVERSLEMVVGLLAILKAGGAYVPLDPTYPAERLAFMLEDTQARVLLTQQHLIESLTLHQTSAICLDTDWEVIAQQSKENLASFVTPDNLAYVIYTSGSTGKPKGVAMSHRSLSNLIEWQLENSTLPKGAKTLQFSPVSFDVSFQEMFSTWCAGGTLVLILEEIRRDPVQLLRFLASEEIARLFLPFIALQQLAEVADSHEAVPTSLREVITAGEQLKITRQIANWFSKLKNCTLHNQYGPSESHVVTAFTLTDSPSYWPALPPIGRPIANTQIHILDAQLQPVPIGVPGELYIGGIALALCYLNRPDLTDQRFIPNPFTNRPGERLYKTGDKARYLPDGNIEFLGRIDYQVKIRGFRIELGEVEAMLAQHPQVQEAVVLSREDIPGNKYLAAYLVAKVEALSCASLPTVSELRSFLLAKLPDYMVPGAFVFLSAMPLTPNGKVDRHALPAPNSSRKELEDKFVAPSTPTEEIVAAIWTEVLGVQQLGILDNFFELGGHSLLATQIISRIREAFKIELPLGQLFEAPTIASLSNSIETSQLAESQEPASGRVALDTLPPLVPAARDTHIPLSRAQQTVWHFQQLYSDSCAYNSPIVLRFTGMLSPKVLEKSINEIIRRHEILRTTFTVVEGQPIQVIAQSLTLPLKIIDLQHLPLEEREASAIRLSAQEGQHHFDLAAGPLIKTTLLRLAPQEHWLLITMHHIITDGWSFGILLQELGTLYSAFSNSLPSGLAEVSVQYADFTLWQRQWLNEQVLQKQFSYWLKKLADIPASLDLLPADIPCNSTNSRRASFYSLVLPKSLVASIEAFSRSQSVTLFAIILTAVKILLFKWSGQTDILVLATTANRHTPTIEKMLGCFINDDVILRSQVDGSQTGLALLKQVKQTVIEAINNQELSLENVNKIIRKFKFIRTISVSMVSLFHGHKVDEFSQALNCEVVSVPIESELWEETIPLELYVSSPTEESQTIEIAGYYNMDLFKKETIERLFGYYQIILQKLVQHPEMKLSEFEWAKDNRFKKAIG